jgi:hypothetical protein
MRNPGLSLRSALIILGLILLVTVVYTRLTRHAFLPDEIAFLPPDSNVVIAIGPVAELWHRAEAQFGRVLREHERQGAIASLLSEISSELSKRNTPIATLDDLTRHGWDVHRGVLLAMQAANTEAEGIAVVPVADRASFLRFVAGDEEPERPACTNDFEGLPEIRQASGLFIAFPKAGLAVISGACERLVAALRHQSSQGEYLRNSDEFTTAVRSLHGQSLLSGPGVFVWLRQLPLGLFWEAGPLVYPAAWAVISLRIEPDVLRVKGEVKVRGANAGLLRRILAPPPAEQILRQQLDPATPAFAELRDGALAHYLDLASRAPTVREVWPHALVAVFDEARRHVGLDQIILAMTGYREGAPQLLLGMSGDPVELDELVLEVQRRLRSERDRAVIAGAVRRWREHHPGEIGPTIADLDLRPEGEAGFAGYRIVEGQVIEPDLPPEARYAADEAGIEGIRYLAPAVTDNDLLYRLPEHELSEQDAASLRSNRFRLPALLTQVALWVATDETDVRAMIERVSAGIRAASMIDAATYAKLTIGINMTSLIEEGLLSGDRQIEKLVEEVLLDFRYHSQLVLQVTTGENWDTVRLLLEARRSPDVGS